MNCHIIGSDSKLQKLMYSAFCIFLLVQRFSYHALHNLKVWIEKQGYELGPIILSRWDLFQLNMYGSLFRDKILSQPTELRCDFEK